MYVFRSSLVLSFVFFYEHIKCILQTAQKFIISVMQILLLCYCRIPPPTRI